MKDILLKGDCLELLGDVSDNSVDMVFTDCPYKITSGGVTNPHGGIFKNANKDNMLVMSGKLFDHNAIEFESWLPEIYRVVKPGTHTYIMVNGRNLSKLQAEAENVGFKFVNLLVWKKNNVTPNRYYMGKTEFILMLRKGGARTINNVGTPNIFEIPNIIGKKLHPTQKPTELLEIFIRNSTNEGDVVLDPFMGSGSTCVACINSGRHYIGYEIDQKYFDIAQDRVNKLKGDKQ